LTIAICWLGASALRRKMKSPVPLSSGVGKNGITITCKAAAGRKRDERDKQVGDGLVCAGVVGPGVVHVDVQRSLDRDGRLLITKRHD
jgi:hypothetical protein